MMLGITGLAMTINLGKKADFQQAIMEKGFYPENLPPVFAVNDFFKAASASNLFDEDQIDRDKPLSLARYNETKRGGQRRIFSTPNPLFFIDVAVYFADHRSKLATHLNQSPISCSTPKFDEDFGRAIKISTFSEFTSQRRANLATSRYIVKSDISRFFPSIYTHSIPWAVHGKEKSKANRKVKDTNIYSNKLDYLIRQAQDQQTVGIPIGPDVSRIVSELIAVAIDKEFLSQTGPDVAASRLVDDVYIGANSLEEAQKLLSAYRDSIRKFELDINENKTSIYESKNDLEPFWPVSIKREIDKFSEQFQDGSQKSEFNAYLDEIIRIANRENDDGIIKYAIRKMDNQKIWNNYWELAEPFLMRVAVNFPHCLDYVARVVAWRNRVDNLDVDKWQKVCISTISHHAPQGNDSEVVWACWMLKELGKKLPSRLCQPIVDRCGPFSVLLAIDLAESNLISGRFPKSEIINRIGKSPMLGNDWLLSYEAERSFDYRVKGKNRNDYSVFGALIRDGASFYKNDALPIVFQGAPDIHDVSEALEDHIGLYDDDDEMDDDIEF